MTAGAQVQRAIQVSTPFGKDVLLLKALSGAERVSGLFQWDLTLCSEQSHLNPDDILGAEVSVSFKRADGGGRFFHGFVSDFAQTDSAADLHEYQVTLRPWLWFLTRASDCRIFQNKSVPQIFEAVAQEYGIHHYKLRLAGRYEPLEYCVQYRETDFELVSRLLEQEGIRYYFEHLDGSHVMVLADDDQAHNQVSGYDTVPYYPPGLPLERRHRDHIVEWSLTHSVQPGAYATRQFDFEQPANQLTGSASQVRRHVRSSFERFEYPARLSKLTAAAAKRMAETRLQELQAAHRVMRGRGSAAGLSAGVRFKLQEHPRADLNIDYVVTEARHTLLSGESAGAGLGHDAYEISLCAIDARTMFRPPRVTPRPVMQGTQTGIVVGCEGDEIYTDQYGRVKVQFHWDRAGQRNEDSSCWIRVAQLWAGQGWGTLHIPRVGQEVVISFLDGDPDQPLVTGTVYNGSAMPSQTLPGAATCSGIKSKSSPGGTASENFNELRFEDKKGAEEIYLHAEKNLNVVVENDQTITIGLQKQGPGARTAQIHQDDTLKIGRHRITEIAGNDTLTIKGERQESVSNNATDKVGKVYKLEAGDSITLECGAAKIVLKKDGDIEISGKSITLNSTVDIAHSAKQKITIEAGVEAKVAATQVGIEARGKTEVKGTLLDLAATGIATLKGSLTKIN